MTWGPVAPPPAWLVVGPAWSGSVIENLAPLSPLAPPQSTVEVDTRQPSLPLWCLGHSVEKMDSWAASVMGPCPQTPPARPQGHKVSAQGKIAFEETPINLRAY